jgi:hypothetical protein
MNRASIRTRSIERPTVATPSHRNPVEGAAITDLPHLGSSKLLRAVGRPIFTVAGFDGH